MTKTPRMVAVSSSSSLLLFVALLLVTPTVWGFGVAPHSSVQQLTTKHANYHGVVFRSSSSKTTKSQLFSATASTDSVAIDANVEKVRFLGQPIPYDDLSIGVLKEVTEGEERVAQTPESVATLVKKGFHVLVEAGGKQKLEK